MMASHKYQIYQAFLKRRTKFKQEEWSRWWKHAAAQNV